MATYEVGKRFGVEASALGLLGDCGPSGDSGSCDDLEPLAGNLEHAATTGIGMTRADRIAVAVYLTFAAAAVALVLAVLAEHLAS